MRELDAVVVGSGPNGLSAAITIARTGRSVLVIEGADSVGGGARTEQLTLPGFHHDVCSAFHPLAKGSPFLSTLPLSEHGLEWIQPDLPLAHAMEPGRSVLFHRDVAATAAGLGLDGASYMETMSRLIRLWPLIADHVLGPLIRTPKHPLALARFGLMGAPSAMRIAGSRFQTEDARALFAGAAAHAFLPLTSPLTASFGWLLLVTGHLFGWPIARGGSGAITNALARYLESLGGTIETGRMVTKLSDIPTAPITILDVGPSGFGSLASDRLPGRYLKRVSRFRHGPGAFKIDYALDGPIPWLDHHLSRAGTIHMGGTAEQINLAETETFVGRYVEDPFTLIGQQSLFDSSRAPDGQHTAWVYAHVPNGSTVDISATITDRVERHAPGFKDLILGSHIIDPNGFQARNPNYVGGDISGGAHNLQQLVSRPFPQRNPYGTPIPGVYLGSASTPPGAGTHGMSGHHAARAALAAQSRDG